MSHNLQILKYSPINSSRHDANENEKWQIVHDITPCNQAYNAHAQMHTGRPES